MRSDRLFVELYRDGDVLAVDKRPGVLSIPGRSTELPDVLTALRSEFGDVFPVHRIDKDTSGVLIFALNAASHAHLSQLFSKRAITKTYLALTIGAPPSDSGVLDYPIATSGTGRSVVLREGKPSLTRYTVMERFKGYALLELVPETGRQHQIRVHLSEAGFPLIIDPLYGSSEPMTIARIKKISGNRERGEAFGTLLDRTPLHAHSLAFTTLPGKVLEITAPLPKDMKATLNQLRKWRAL